MSLITRCPACATLFKVVPDQLRVSEGLVRCGQCDVVFDANAYLKPYVASADSPSISSQSEGTAASPLQTQESDDATAYQDLEDARHDVERLQAIVDGSHHTDMHPLDGQGLVEPIAEPTASAAGHAPGDGEAPSAYSVASQAQTVQDVQARYPGADAKYSFMRKPSRRSKRRQKRVRILLTAFSVVLLVVLLLQFVVHERDRIASAQPGTKPLLMALCNALGCEISPLRQIESVVIDSSSFVNVGADVYRLSFTLKNTAPIDIATPALELTLTDLQDQAVIRRVITPSDYGSASVLMAAGTDMSMTLPMSIKLTDRVEKYSAYRVVIFYP